MIITLIYGKGLFPVAVRTTHAGLSQLNLVVPLLHNVFALIINLKLDVFIRVPRLKKYSFRIHFKPLHY